MAESGSADRGRFKLCLRKDITVEDYVETPAGDGYGSAKLALRLSREKEWFRREAAARVGPLAGDCAWRKCAY